MSTKSSKKTAAQKQFGVPGIPVPFSVVDLFAGAGGLSEGFRQAGYNVLAGSDVDPDAAATYALNFPEARTVVGDLCEGAVLEEIGDFAATADVIIGGPPCQAWSQVRNHRRLIDDPRNALYRQFVQIVARALPSAFVMENVTGIDQMGARAQMLADLRLDGEYDLYPQILDAADFGVPQTRKRLLFIGVRRSLNSPELRINGTGVVDRVTLLRNITRRQRYQIAVADDSVAHALAAQLADPSDISIVSVRQAISDLAKLIAGNRIDEFSAEALPAPESAYQALLRENVGPVVRNLSVPRINADTRLRLEAIPPGGNYRDLDESLMERYLTGQRWGQDNGTGRLSRRHFYAYRRLHPDIWAWTLNTKADAVYHYAIARSLSVREFARLQSFPDRFVFTTDQRKGLLPGRIDGGAAHSRYRQVGNAVPPLLARAVAKALQTALSEASVHPRKTA